jgi:hypothetical protein
MATQQIIDYVATVKLLMFPDPSIMTIPPAIILDPALASAAMPGSLTQS